MGRSQLQAPRHSHLNCPSSHPRNSLPSNRLRCRPTCHRRCLRMHPHLSPPVSHPFSPRTCRCRFRRHCRRLSRRMYRCLCLRQNPRQSRRTCPLFRLPVRLFLRHRHYQQGSPHQRLRTCPRPCHLLYRLPNQRCCRFRCLLLSPRHCLQLNPLQSPRTCRLRCPLHALPQRLPNNLSLSLRLSHLRCPRRSPRRSLRTCQRQYLLPSRFLCQPNNLIPRQH